MVALSAWPKPPHSIIDADKRIALICQMEQVGWVGPPLVVHQVEPELVAVTGAHRLAAAREAGLLPEEIPAVHLRELFVIAGLPWSAGWDFAGAGYLMADAAGGDPRCVRAPRHPPAANRRATNGGGVAERAAATPGGVARVDLRTPPLRIAPR